MSAVLEIRDLAVSFPGRDEPVTAVAGVDLTVDRGRTLALVGESGAGKSTVANTVLGLNRQAEGSVALDGIDLLTLDERGWRAARRSVQIVFQDPIESLTPRMRVRDLISEPLRLLAGIGRRDAAVEAQRLLGEVELDQSYLDKYPTQLSGGEAQRVAIARAIAVEPALVVLDEPTSALDAMVRGAIHGLLAKIQERRETAFLLITHDLASVRRLAHSVAVMCAGEVLEQGPAAKVLESPSHPYTRALLAADLGSQAPPAARASNHENGQGGS